MADYIYNSEKPDDILKGNILRKSKSEIPGNLYPFVCPVCGGRGTVPWGFYNYHGSSTTCAMPEMCRSCQGTGIVWR